MNIIHQIKFSIGVLSLGLFLASTSVFAVESKKSDFDKVPFGCRDVGYQFDLKLLELFPESAGTRNSLYFVFNSLDKPIKLHHMRDQGSAQTLHLNHRIPSKRWAVLSTCEKHIKYLCTVDDRKSPFGAIVDCGKSLKVCEFARVRFGLNTRGNFWLAKGNTRNGAVREVVWYGIIPQ